MFDNRPAGNHVFTENRCSLFPQKMLSGSNVTLWNKNKNPYGIAGMGTSINQSEADASGKTVMSHGTVTHQFD